MDFSTSDIPATGADRRPGRETGSTKEGRRARGGCVDL